MGNQPPSDPAGAQVRRESYGLPGTPALPEQPSEYIPNGAPQQTYAPFQPPAYLYPLPSSLLATPTSVAPTSDKWPTRGLALAGFILGLMSIVLWIIPGLGDAVAIGGFACSILGWRPPARKWMVIAGCACSLAGLALGIYNSVLGSAIFPH
jgi:hypothetical protein